MTHMNIGITPLRVSKYWPGEVAKPEGIRVFWALFTHSYLERLHHQQEIPLTCLSSRSYLAVFCALLLHVAFCYSAASSAPSQQSHHWVAVGSLLLRCRSGHLEHLSCSSASLTLHLISNLHWTFIFSTLPIPLNFSLHLFALFSNITAFSITELCDTSREENRDISHFGLVGGIQSSFFLGGGVNKRHFPRIGHI